MDAELGVRVALGLGLALWGHDTKQGAGVGWCGCWWCWWKLGQVDDAEVGEAGA